jgi:predicted deacylase
MRNNRAAWAAAVTGCLAGVLVSAQVKIPRVAPAAHDIRPGVGWTVKPLSAFDAGLRGTAGDTPVYVFEGAQPGGTVFVAGGTHGNEIAGFMAATLLVERARVQRGRLIVVPHANNSAISWMDPARRIPRTFTIKTASGIRTFMAGSRLTNPAHQGEPDPPRSVPAGGSEYAFDNEVRNLDRAYPGTAGGNLTQRIANAVVSLLKRERVDVAFDLHEAAPDSRLALMIVANPKNIELGASAVLALEERGLQMKLEASSSTFRGLSHREWGDATQARAFLFETPSPASDPKSAGDLVNHPTWPLARRVGIHLATLMAVVEAYNSDAPADRRVELLDVPDLEALATSGLGAFLR